MSATSVLFDAPGPKGRARNIILGVVAVVVVVVVVGLLIHGLRSQLTAEKWAPFAEAGTWQFYVLPGLLNTLQAALISVVLAIVFGVLLGMGRLSTNAAIRIPCSVFVEFFRAVPVLMMMIFFYSLFLFSGALQGALLPLAGVICGLVFYNSCVIAELVRSGVRSLPKGQREAGLAVGMTSAQTLRAILLPQAITAMLPSLMSQLVVILKDTALGYIITYPELIRSLQTLASGRSNLIASMLVAAAIMITLNYLLTFAATRLERRLRQGRRRAPGTTAPTAPGTPPPTAPVGGPGGVPAGFGGGS